MNVRFIGGATLAEMRPGPDLSSAGAVAPCSEATASAKYYDDGQGRRVKKQQGAAKSTLFVYDAFGNLAAEYDTQPAPNLMAGAYYRTTDHLGSTRLVTNASGGVVSRRDFFPFGEQIDDTWGNRQLVSDGNTFTTYNREFGVHQKFTGKERDTESSLDYFGARYFSASLGKFTSVDPGNAGANPASPQSWNGFSYVNNNPLNLVDPDGQQGVPANVQKMLDLLRAPLSKNSGFPKGGLIQLAIEKPINFLLGETFGYPSRAVRGNLDVAEGRFLDRVSSFEKGALMLGVGRRNDPGIDAVDLDNQAGISLKTAASVNALGRNAELALKQVEDAGFYNVQVYVDAPNLSNADATGLTKIQNTLGGQGRITKVVVFTSEGTVTYRPTEDQQKQIERCRESDEQGGSCQ